MTTTESLGSLELSPLEGRARPLDEWLTTFHLAVVVLDPYTHESAWLIDTAGRVLTTLKETDSRVGWLVTAGPKEAREFLGPWADALITFCDAERTLVAAMGLDTLPAFVHIDQQGRVVDAAEGWDPPAWRRVSARHAEAMGWIAPTIPGPDDPAPYRGTPASGA